MFFLKTTQNKKVWKCCLTGYSHQKSWLLGLEQFLQEVQGVLNLIRRQVAQVRQLLGTQPSSRQARLATAVPAHVRVDAPEPHLQPFLPLLHLFVLPEVVHELDLTHRPLPDKMYIWGALVWQFGVVPKQKVIFIAITLGGALRRSGEKRRLRLTLFYSPDIACCFWWPFNIKWIKLHFPMNYTIISTIKPSHHKTYSKN